MFGSIKIAIVLIMLAGAGGGFVYVKNIKADLATSEANNAKLLDSVSEQQSVIEQQKKDFSNIMEANKRLQETTVTLAKEMAALDDKFNKTNSSGKKRDIGDLAIARTKTIEKIINRASANAQRCVEISMGAELTEKEINATKKSQINSECPSIANPNYIPY